MYQEKDFELDWLWGREPMQFLKDRSDVVQQRDWVSRWAAECWIHWILFRIWMMLQ